MVGKPNVVSSDQTSLPSQGAAMTTPGLNSPLDQEREASMADEGGAAGAFMESQARAPGPDPRADQDRPQSPSPRWTWWIIGGGVAAGFLLGSWLGRRSCPSGR